MLRQSKLRRVLVAMIRVFSLLVFSLTLSALSYQAGKEEGRHTGLMSGYIQGQVDFASVIISAIGEKVNASTGKDTYHRFMSVKNINLYVATRNNVKTTGYREYDPYVRP